MPNIHNICSYLYFKNSSNIIMNIENVYSLYYGSDNWHEEGEDINKFNLCLNTEFGEELEDD
jgi:hypothetical protein